MPARRRFPLREIARSLRGLAAVVGVAAIVSALVVTGRPHALRASAAAVRPAARVGVVTKTSVRPDIAGALALFGLRPGTTGGVAERVTRSHARRPLHRWVRPNDGPLTSPFGMRWGRLHAGIDLAGPWGSPILAATDGCISYAGPMDGYGEVMQIADWDGTETVYGHMSSFVRRSGCVHAGDVIARVGAAGDATGAHLHFEVRVNGVPVDPIRFLARRGLGI